MTKWVGGWVGAWDGQPATGGSTVVNAGLIVSGASFARFDATVIEPPRSGGGGGVDRSYLRWRTEFDARMDEEDVLLIL